MWKGSTCMRKSAECYRRIPLQGPLPKEPRPRWAVAAPRGQHAIAGASLGYPRTGSAPRKAGTQRRVGLCAPSRNPGLVLAPDPPRGCPGACADRLGDGTFCGNTDTRRPRMSPLGWHRLARERGALSSPRGREPAVVLPPGAPKPVGLGARRCPGADRPRSCPGPAGADRRSAACGRSPCPLPGKSLEGSTARREARREVYSRRRTARDVACASGDGRRGSRGS